MRPGKRLRQIRNKFAPFFFWIIAATVCLVALSVLVIVGIVFFYKSDDASSAAVEKALMAQTIQMSLGMVLGLVVVSFGVAMTWVAIEAPFVLRAKGDVLAARSGVSLQSVSPGIVLIVGGMILIGLSLYLPLHYSVTDDSGQKSLNRQGSITEQLEPVKERVKPVADGKKNP